MNNKNNKTYLSTLQCVFTFIAAMLFFDNMAFADKTLAVPQVNQLPQDNWCWAASSQAVLSFTGNAPGMCSIADWARQKNAWGNDDCCTNGTGGICNQPNNMFGSAGSIENILSQYKADSERFGRSLNLKEVKDFIDDDSPIIVRWGWTAGGGHFVVLRGYTGGNMDIMNPWDGPQTFTHSDLTSTTARTWTHTLVVKPKKIAFVVDDTGSMWDDIDAVKTTLQDQIAKFKSDGRFVKYSLITYKDDVTNRGTTLKHDEINTWIAGLSASGGDDCPEEGYGALDASAEKAKGSEVWWMTDADSHGGFTRMLATQFRLLLAGNTLHSTILGSCSSPAMAIASAVSTSAGGGQVSSQNNSIPYLGIRPEHFTMASPLGGDGIASLALLLDVTGDVNAFTTGETLSDGTGGLFFAVNNTTIQGATKAVLEEMSSTAIIQRVKLGAGSHIISIPVDESVSVIKFLVEIRTGGTGTINVKDPDGVELKPSVVAGVEEIIAGDSRMLLVKAPALKKGIYTVSSTSDLEYLLSVSGISHYGADLIGDSTVGIGKSLATQLAIPGLVPQTGLAGPGPGGPGGLLPAVVIPSPTHPFDPAKLKFFVIMEDGSGRQPLTLYDDGSHDDKLPGDGIYGGTLLAPSAASRFRIGVDDGGLFYRVTKLLVVAGAVSAQGPKDKVALPGNTFNHVFTIQNLGSATRTYDLVSTSTLGWENVGAIIPSLTIDPASAKTVEVPVSVPLTAASGDSSVLTLTAVAHDEPTVNDSVSVKITAWTGPLLQTLNPASIQRDQDITLAGSGMGSDPGTGNRSTNLNNVTIAGQRLPDANVIRWQDTLIKVRIPGLTNSGLVTVTANGIQSNPLELVVLPSPSECLFNWAEKNYSTLFAPPGSVTKVWTVYAYRYYAETNAYLGVNSVNNHVYYMGSDGVLRDEGPLADWLPKAGCGAPPPPPPGDCLFNWGETNYPDLFAPSGSPWMISSIDWTYRYYSATDSYLGVKSTDNHVYYMGTDGQQQDEGQLSDWLTKAGCP